MFTMPHARSAHHKTHETRRHIPGIEGKAKRETRIKRRAKASHAIYDDEVCLLQAIYPRRMRLGGMIMYQ
jgi:hypothetical protein